MASKSYTLLEYLVTIETELKKLKKIVAESVGSDYSELIANIDGIRNELNTFKTTITDTVDTNNSEITSKFNNLEQQFNTFKTSITNTVNSNNSAITSQVSTLYTQFSQFKTNIESQVSSLNTRVTSVENRVTTLENSGGSGGSGGSVNINDNTISNTSTWSSEKIEDFTLNNSGVVWTTVQGENLSIQYTKEGYLRNVEILGNTTQDTENLTDIQHLGELTDNGKYKIDIQSGDYSTSILLPCQISKVNNISDRVYWDNEKGKYVIEKNIVSETYSNNTGWSVWYHTDNILRFMKTPSVVPVDSTSLKIISNKLPSVGYNINQENIYINNGKVYLIIDSSKLSSNDLVGLNGWLTSQGLTVYYQRKNPELIETNILEQVKIPCYINKTQLFVTGGIIGGIKCNAPLDGGQAIQSLTEENNTQDILIDTTMLATDEIYTMIEPILDLVPQNLSLERGVSKMVDMYVAMLQRGIKTIDQVPVRYREEVRRVLEELEK